LIGPAGGGAELGVILVVFCDDVIIRMHSIKRSVQYHRYIRYVIMLYFMMYRVC
jgi:hypothetical protein